ncbi:MAG: hypothetical protein JWR67_3693 [Mucilaginibacter sp.]|nr:hypothetical protein [Mucilaginibacter sp.]
MKQPFSATLTGSDSQIEGIAKPSNSYGSKNAWQFDSIDDSLHLVIVEDEKGYWHRIAGTEPYFSGWTDELAEQIKKQ